MYKSVEESTRPSFFLYFFGAILRCIKNCVWSIVYYIIVRFIFTLLPEYFFYIKYKLLVSNENY